MHLPSWFVCKTWNQPMPSSSTGRASLWSRLARLTPRKASTKSLLSVCPAWKMPKCWSMKPCLRSAALRGRAVRWNLSSRHWAPSSELQRWIHLLNQCWSLCVKRSSRWRMWAAIWRRTKTTSIFPRKSWKQHRTALPSCRALCEALARAWKMCWRTALKLRRKSANTMGATS